MILVYFFTVAMYKYERDVVIQYYLNPNHKKGTEFRPPNPNTIIEVLTCPKRRRVAATIAGLWFLDTALYLN